MNSNRLQVRRVHAQYLVPSDHPSPLRLKDRLDDEMKRNLAQSLSNAFSGWFSEADASLWFVRELQIDLTVNAAARGDHFEKELTSNVARTLGATLDDSADQSNVVHFASRSAYLSRFLYDLVSGDAWSHWYYESFQGLRMLSTSAALRTAMLDQAETGCDALSQLDARELNQVLRALTRQDSRRTLDGFAEALPAGDQFECFKRVWSAWQEIPVYLFDGLENEGKGLYLYVRAGRDQFDAGLNLKRSTLALLCLADCLANGTEKRNAKLVLALMEEGVASLYEVARADAEILMPLKQCPQSWLLDVVQKLNAQAGRPGTQDTTATGLRDTPFGGAFLLLPILDELPLEEATSGWLHSDEGAAISLVRFLLLIKLCGQKNATRVFHDPLLRELLLIPDSISIDTIREWQSHITDSQRANFLRVLLEWQHARRTVRASRQILATTSLKGRPVVVLIDGSSGLWMWMRRYSPRRVHQVVESLNNFALELESNDGLLLCDPIMLEPLWTAFPTLKILSVEDATQVVKEEDQINNIICRLDYLGNDVSYLTAPQSFRFSPSFDMTLSVVAHNVLQSFAWKLPGFASSNLPYLAQNFLEFTASVEEETTRRVVRLGRPPLQLVLGITGMTRQSYRLSWLDERPITLFQEM